MVMGLGLLPFYLLSFQLSLHSNSHSPTFLVSRMFLLQMFRDWFFYSNVEITQPSQTNDRLGDQMCISFQSDLHISLLKFYVWFLRPIILPVAKYGIPTLKYNTTHSLSFSFLLNQNFLWIFSSSRFLNESYIPFLITKPLYRKWFNF